MTFKRKAAICIGTLMTAGIISFSFHEEHYGKSTSSKPVKVEQKDFSTEELLGKTVLQAEKDLQQNEGTLFQELTQLRDISKAEQKDHQEKTVAGDEATQAAKQKAADHTQEIHSEKTEQAKHTEEETTKTENHITQQPKTAHDSTQAEVKRESEQREAEAAEAERIKEAEQQEALRREEEARWQAEQAAEEARLAEEEAQRQAAEAVRAAEEARIEAERQAEQQRAEEAARAEAEAARIVEEQQKLSAPNMLIFNGTALPLVDTQGAGAAPYADMAGIWTGSGSTTDGAPSHFIGHNPGAFTGLLSLGVGSEIRVNDRDGYTRVYIVKEIMEVDDLTCDANGYDHWSDLFECSGERISLQTCLGDNWNRIVIAE